MKEITWDQFTQVQLLVGTILTAEDFPEARNPSYKVTVDLGELGIKKSSAQITDLYTKEELIGKQIVCVANFPEKQIANIKSQVLITGFYDEGKSVILAIPDKKAPNGSRLV
jgi:tRNA-binding protein